MATNPFINLATQFTSSVDQTNDAIPFWQHSTGEAFWVNNATFNNIAGAVVGTTDSQTLTNKVLTSPTISGPTLSGTVAGTYTIGGTPTFPASVVTLTGSQTLTNKVLTSPTINGGTVSNATVDADTIAGYTASTTGTVYGVGITSGVIGSGGITSASLATGVVEPVALMSGTGTSWVWQTWSPTFVNLSGGTLNWSTYTQIGKTVFYRLKYTLGGAGVSGSVTFTLPATSNASYDPRTIIGAGFASTAPGSFYKVDVGWGSTTTAVLFASQVGTTYISEAVFSSSTPVTWASGSLLSVQGSYEAV